MRRALIVGLATGCVLGAATRLVYELPHEWWWLAKLGAPWLAVAFSAGFTSPRLRHGAFAGSICLISATLVYYAIMGLLQHVYNSSPLGLKWLLVAVPAGLAFGALGSAVRTEKLRAPAAGMLSAAFAAEAVLTAHGSRVGPAALLAGALAVPLALGRSNSEHVLLFGWAAALSVVAMGAGRVVFAATGYG